MEWNCMGKLGKVTDTLANQQVVYSYDGRGNRIMKDIVNPAGNDIEKHKVEYYVRDASGNILAVYKENYRYGKLLPIQTTNGNAKATAGIVPFVGFLAQNIAPVAGFEPAFLTYAVDSDVAWAASLTGAKPVSFFMSRDADITNRMLLNDYADDYRPDLRSYDITGNLQIFSGALALAAPATRVNIIRPVLTANANTVTTQALIHYQHYFPIAAAGLWSYFGVDFGPDSAANATALTDVLAAREADRLNAASQMDNTIAADMLYDSSNIALPFYKTLMADDAIFNNATLHSASTFDDDLARALNNGNDSVKQQLYTFFDGWSSAAAKLGTEVTAEEKLKVVYEDNDSLALGSYVTSTDSSHLDQIIASLPTLTVYDYLDKVNTSPQLGVYSLTPDLGLIEGTIKLAEHHLYGSSRLGIQSYDSTRYMNVYVYGAPSMPWTTLSKHKSWYSYASADLIKKDEKTPWGNISGSGEYDTVTRVVGKKFFELSDHLGNVLATVLDRKTGAGSTGVGTLYTSWHADVASATDYYPGGMMMVERNIFAGGDTSKHRFGFNGQMKDNEIAGLGNHNTALYGEYDTRTVVRWNIDPKSKPSISVYGMFGGNPIRNNDFLLDVFKVSNGQNATQERKDVKDLAITKHKDGTTTDNSKYVNIASDGTVSLNFGDMTKSQQDALISSDVGLSLINDLVNAKDEKGKDLTFVYIVGNVNKGRSRNGKYNVTSEGGILSITTTSKRIGLSPNEDPEVPDDILPPDGIAALTRIPNGRFFGFNEEPRGPYAGGSGIQVRRASILYHELRENWFRVIMKMPYRKQESDPSYKGNPSRGYYQGYSGAHNSSVQLEGNSYGNDNPGGYGCMDKE